MNSTPLHVSRTATVTAVAATTASAATLSVWVLGRDTVLGDWPMVVLMVYLATLALAAGALVVRQIARIQLALHEAFTAGYKTGVGTVRAPEQRGGRGSLHLVE